MSDTPKTDERELTAEQEAHNFTATAYTMMREQRDKLEQLEQERDSLRARVTELEKDKERLDWLQSGHCVLCLSSKSCYEQPYEFEIDGHQDAPRSADVRLAIDAARKKQP